MVFERDTEFNVQIDLNIILVIEEEYIKEVDEKSI